MGFLGRKEDLGFSHGNGSIKKKRPHRNKGALHGLTGGRERRED